MAKYWFGTLEHIEDQHSIDGKTLPISYKPVKGWRVPASDFKLIARDKGIPGWLKNLMPQWLENWLPAEHSELDLMIKERDALAEQWWKEAEDWNIARRMELMRAEYKGRGEDLLKAPQIILDLPETWPPDFQPARETGHYQIKVTGPVEIPEQSGALKTIKAQEKKA